MVFRWSLSDSKFPQVSRTLLSILTDLNNTAFWMVSTCPFISKFSSLFIDPLVSTKNTNYNWYKRHFHVPQLFFQFSRKVEVFILLFTFLLFYSVVIRGSKFVIIIYSLRIFHISVKWRSFTEVWVTASLLKSPGLFSVLWPSSTLP